jgi:DNA-binding transcriptional MerR regulator
MINKINCFYICESYILSKIIIYTILTLTLGIYCTKINTERLLKLTFMEGFILPKKFTVDEVSDRLGITPRTLHYYEELGLLAEIPRTEGGHRYYDEEIIAQLEYILKLKNLLGISLQDIRTILDTEEDLTRIKELYYKETTKDEKTALLDQATQLLQSLISGIDEKIVKLQMLREGFAKRLLKAEELQQS